MLARTFSATLHGIDGAVVEIEASRQNSLPRILITGLPGETIRESRERVRACLNEYGFDVPSAQILIHLSPASNRKQGTQLDLAIALATLAAEECLPAPALRQSAFLGELALDGRLHAVHGALSLLEALEARPDVARIFVPKGNASAARRLQSRKAIVAETLGEVIDVLRGQREARGVGPTDEDPADEPIVAPSVDEIVGQTFAKRALGIALAGRHHLLLLGSPGVGKSLLARCAQRLLPPLTVKEQLQVMKNFTFAPGERGPARRRPFRAPHHTISAQGLLGGGSGGCVPGEVTLAHTGLLFLDEFPEFRRDALEGLREPLQNGTIHLHRVGHSAVLRARFTLLAAMNPCPCGHSLSSTKRCTCSLDQRRRYRQRISGPILDRMDMCLVMSSAREATSGPDENTLKGWIEEAWKRQDARLGEGRRNGDVDVALGAQGFELEQAASEWLAETRRRFEPSWRAVDKVVKVARTIADIERCDGIAMSHLIEAWELRAAGAASWDV